MYMTVLHSICPDGEERRPHIESEGAFVRHCLRIRGKKGKLTEDLSGVKLRAEAVEEAAGSQVLQQDDGGHQGVCDGGRQQCNRGRGVQCDNDCTSNISSIHYTVPYLLL